MTMQQSAHDRMMQAEPLAGGMNSVAMDSQSNMLGGTLSIR